MQEVLPKGVKPLDGRSPRQKPTEKPWFLRQAYGPVAHEDEVIWAVDPSEAIRQFYVRHGLNGGKVHMYQMRAYDIDPSHPMAKAAKPKRRGRPKSKPTIVEVGEEEVAPIVNPETGEVETVPV